MPSPIITPKKMKSFLCINCFEQYLSTENLQNFLIKKLKKSQINGKACYIHGLEYSIQQRCQFSPNSATGLRQCLSKPKQGMCVFFCKHRQAYSQI